VRCYTERCIATASRLSFRLRYRDHKGWYTSRIISRSVNLGYSLCEDSNNMDVFNREHPEILAGIGVEYRKKVALGVKKL